MASERERGGGVGCASGRVFLQSICRQRRSSSEPTKQGCEATEDTPHDLRLLQAAERPRNARAASRLRGRIHMNAQLRRSACKAYSGGAVAPGRTTCAWRELQNCILTSAGLYTLGLLETRSTIIVAMCAAFLSALRSDVWAATGSSYFTLQKPDRVQRSQHRSGMFAAAI